MAKDKLQQARDLMDKGNYREARALLKKMNDPQAKKLLARIDDLEEDESPGGGGGAARDIVQVLLFALIGVLIFGGGGFAIASGMGIKYAATPIPGSTAAAIVPTGEGGSAPVSVPTAAPTDIPTATPVPCDAPGWWNAVGVPLSKVADSMVKLSINTRPADIQAAKNNLAAWEKTLNSTTPADCTAAAQQKMQDAVPAADALFAAYLTTTTPQQRSDAFIKLMDALLPVTDEIDKLQIANPGAWVKTVQDFSRGDCTAWRWYVEVFEGRDYARYFTVFSSLDFKSPADVQAKLRDMQSLRSSFAGEKYPTCAEAAQKHFLGMMDAYFNSANSRLNGDNGAADAHLKQGQLEKGAFYNEMMRLDPALAGVRAPA
jgi:hypothetical protein